MKTLWCFQSFREGFTAGFWSETGALTCLCPCFQLSACYLMSPGNFMYCITNLKFGRWPLCQGSAADNMTKCDQIISLWARGAVCFHLRSRDVAGGGLTSVETEYSHFVASRAIWAVCILPCPRITLSAEIGRDELQLVQVQLPAPVG